MLPTATQTVSASLASLVRDYTTYNLWANCQLVKWLKTKPAELFEQEVPSSFRSLKATLLHIWDLERCWFAHVKQQPVTSFRQEGFDGTLEEILEGILAESEAIDDYASFISEEQLQEGCFFSMPYAGDHMLPAFEIILHAMNDSTYHRGQLVTIGRALGLIDAPITDYMYYLLRVK